MRGVTLRPTWLPVAASSLAGVVVVASLGGILLPSTYAQETPSWRAQGIGQDGFDLLVLVPLLIVSGSRRFGGSRPARMLVGGAFIYAAYSFTLYAFDVHFNALFLFYCAGLGISFFSLAGLLAAALRDDPGAWLEHGAPARVAGWFLVVLGTLFAALWLSEVAPALARGTSPASLREAGLVTNPVHVLDLSILLPAIVASGASLVRRRPFGSVLGPMMLAFTFLMLLAIISMFVAMRVLGFPTDLSPVPVLGALAVASVALFSALVRRLRSDGSAPTASA